LSAVITTEAILTSPRGFGLTTATRLQRALCRVVDGLPLGDLSDVPELEDAVGNIEALANCGLPFEVHVLAAIRTAKSLIAAAKIVQLSQTVDVSGLGDGDIVRIPLAALKIEGTRPVMSHLVKNLQAKPLLRALIIGEPKRTGVVLRHPSGRPIEVTPIPIDRAGGSALSVWNAGIIVDEEPRMLGATDGVKNWDHLRQAVLGRILPGGQFLGIGSPWAPFGPIYKMVVEHWGRPTKDLVVFRGRGPAMNPSWWTPKRMADLERRDPTAFRTDCLADFADVEDSLFFAVEVEAAERQGPVFLPFNPDAIYVAAMDPATRSNGWTAVLLEITFQSDGARRVRVAWHRQWLGRRGSPLSPASVLRELAGELSRYSVTTVTTDQFSVDAIRDLASNVGLRVRERTISGPLKVEMFDELHALVASGQIELPPDALMRGDLLSVRKRVTQNGLAIDLPKTRDGRHADYAAALALGVHVAPKRPAVSVPMFQMRREPEEWNVNAGFEQLDGIIPSRHYG